MNDFLSAWDSTTPGKPHIPRYMFLTEALERCQSTSDVQAMLAETNRDGGLTHA